MSKHTKPHVFVSYVREDAQLVDELCDRLKRRGIEVWLDREKIMPGERWQVSVRRAIQDGAFFIACFSESFETRMSSYMNVELTIAVEQLRYRPTDRAWFIPVLFKGGTVPDRPIGGGETLRDIQWIELYKDLDDGIEKIINVIQPKFPEPPLLPGTPEQIDVIILITDIVASTLFKVEYDTILNSLQKLLNVHVSAAQRHEGQYIKLLGDGIIATFDSASKAISCAKEIQTSMLSIDELNEKSNFGVRVGLSAGKVLKAQGDVIGSAVNITARICSLADRGEVLIEETVRLMIGEGQFNFRDKGNVAIKGFSKRIRLYELQNKNE